MRARGLAPLVRAMGGLDLDERAPPRTALSANGAPVQLCVSADPGRERHRVVVDPGSCERDPVRRAAQGILALDRLLAGSGHRDLATPCRRLIATVIPSDPLLLEAYRDGVLWLGASPNGPGLALYCEAAPLGRDAGWDVAARAAVDLVADPGNVVSAIDSLRVVGEVASIALEGSSPDDLRFKIYFRLLRPTPLAMLGKGFDVPVLLDFIARVIEDRSPRLAGLVLSRSVRVRDGALLDAKIDLCACPACGARPTSDWSALLDRLGGAFGFPTIAAREAVADPGLEVALIGLAQRDGRALRLNTYLAPRVDRTPRDRVLLGVERAVEYLLRAQERDGHWRDYERLGGSDQWVTALAGLSLAEASVTFTLRHARRAAERGARWLDGHRASPEAWGFSAIIGPDADSTAHAVLLFQALGRPVSRDSLAWLEALWRKEGGFATYDRADAWGAGHPCVTPAVYMALHQAGRRALRADVLAYLRCLERPDGSWPSYWWTSPSYAEYATLRLLRTLGEHAWLRSRAHESRTYEFRTSLQLACSVGAEAIRPREPHVVSRLALELLAHQDADGCWPGGADLRVTSPSCFDPWDHPSGEMYRDERGLMTTAMCLRALRDAWECL